MDMRKIMSLVLAIVMVVGMCPVQAFAAGEDGPIVVSSDTATDTTAESTTDPTVDSTESTVDSTVPAEASDACGDNVSWTLENGVLTISGEGATWDYTTAGAVPWGSDRYSIESVVVEDGVTHIGKFLLADHMNVRSISLPSTLTSIGMQAFFCCSSLESVTLPQGLITLGSSAFYGCDALESITIPSTVTELGGAVFNECDSLRSVVIEEGVKEISSSMFDGCTALTDVTLPGSVVTIQGAAFYDCTSLKNIILPEGLESLKSQAFHNTGLESITLPASLTELNGYPFDCCNSLAAIHVAEGSETYSSLDGAVYDVNGTTLMMVPSGLTAFTVPKTVLKLGFNAFYGCDLLQSVVFTGDAPIDACGFRNSVTIYYPGDNETWTDEAKAAYSGTITWVAVSACGDSAYWSFDETTGTLTIFGEGEATEIAWSDHKDSITAVVVEEGITSIPVGAFSGYTALISASLPTTMTEIPIGSFYNTGLTEVAVPEGVTAIGMSAFGDCANLTTLTLPGTLTEIGNAAFQNCAKLTDLVLPEGLTTLVTGAFWGCTSLTELVLPESLTMIWGDVFRNCTGLAAVTIPAGVQTMYWSVFNSCTNLTEITFQGDAPNNTQTAEDGTVTTYPVLANLTATAYYPADNATWTEEIMTSYGGTITWVAVIPTSGTCGENATWSFDEATGTLTITGTGAVDSYPVHMGQYAPWYDLRDEVISVVVGEGITEVGTYTLFNMSNLKTVSYSSTVITINPNINCKVIEEYIVAADNPYLKTHDGAVINVLTNAVVVVPTAKAGSFTVPDEVTMIEAQAFLHCAQITEVILPAGLERIEFNAFYGCDNLSSIEIPASVTFMGLEAFASCDNLVGITFLGDAPTCDGDAFYGVTATAYYPAGNTTWTEEVMASYGGTITWVAVIPTSGTCGENAYWVLENGVLTVFGEGKMTEFVGSPEEYPWYTFKDQITAVVVESGVTNVGAYAFAYDYPNLQRADLGAVTVGSSAFDGCAALTEVLLPDDLETIGGRAFAETGITGIELPEGLSAIGGEAFMGSKLTSVTIPGTVTEWSNGAFQECLDLKDATLGDGLTGVPSYLFVGCTALETVEIPSTATYIGECSFKGCSALDNVVIPESVTTLYAEAFADCVSLSSIEIPASVMLLLAPFRRCTGLTEITFLGDAPAIYDDRGFKDMTVTIYYPGGNDTWTEEIMQQYGGTITWVPYTAGQTVSFTDVTDPTVFYYEPVAWAVANGITTGTTPTTFSPNVNCERAQIVTFLWRAAGQPEPESTVNPFEDVKETDYFYKAVLWAVENGITNGMDDTHFEPFMECTRGQAVTFLWRVAGKPMASDTSSFNDVAPGTYYYDAVNWAVENEITNGMGDNEFQPDSICTRGQIVTFLYRYMN